MPDQVGSSPLRVGLAVDVDVAHRARWVFESIFAALDTPWTTEGGGAPLLGYGCDGTAVSLPYDPAAWDTAEEPTTDPVARAFWWLARVEERDGVAPPEAFDDRGRFRWDRSALSAPHAPAPSGNSADPAPDALARSIAEALGLPAPTYPGDAPAALVLTHDIDMPWRWTRQGFRRAARALLDTLRAGAVRAAARQAAALAAIPMWRLRGTDPWCNGRRILELERSYGAVSTSYILVASHHPADGDGASARRGAERFARDVLDAGGSVGLHGSYRSSEADGMLAEERAQLEHMIGRAVRHHRFHYLRFQPTRDWSRVEAAGLATDATLGYAEHPGLRSGFSWPYRAWDHGADRPSNLLVVPLGLMDATLEPRYLNIGLVDAWPAVVEPLLASWTSRGAAVSVLWHNDKVATRSAGWWSELYERILATARDQGIWLTDVDGIEAEWRARIARTEI